MGDDVYGNSEDLLAACAIPRGDYNWIWTHKMAAIFLSQSGAKWPQEGFWDGGWVSIYNMNLGSLKISTCWFQPLTRNKKLIIGADVFLKGMVSFRNCPCMGRNTHI